MRKILFRLYPVLMILTTIFIVYDIWQGFALGWYAVALGIMMFFTGLVVLGMTYKKTPNTNRKKQMRIFLLEGEQWLTVKEN